jgi:alkanesulfonate monooxygenase SsuD/methylene tetrahydromethanopterin reductase-like flavin-dependent oxidoreductase (luciferase family)
MFNVKQREHEARYDYAQEWIDAIKLIWSDRSDVDFTGRYIQLKGIRAHPKPFGGQRPLIMNAGASATGQAFAVRNCDAFFIQASRVSVDETAARIAAIRHEAAKLDRAIDFYTVGLVVCRPTKREAQEFFDHAILDHADWSAIDRIMQRRNVSSKTIGLEEYEQKRRAVAVNMGGLPIIGDPDEVAEKLAGYARGGLTGVAISLINFLDEAPYFCQEVLARLARLGLRQPSA